MTGELVRVNLISLVGKVDPTRGGVGSEQQGWSDRGVGQSGYDQQAAGSRQ